MTADADRRAPPGSASVLGRVAAPRRGRRVPFVAQLHTLDCGAACLAMVLAFHGRRIGLDAAREEIGAGVGAATALALLHAARRQGFIARGLSLDLDDLRRVRPGAIVHWQFNHWIVFERITRHGVEIVDPALGRRVVPLGDFRRGFTGVVLELVPGEAFEPLAASGGRVWAYVRRLFGEAGLLPRVLSISLVLRLLALALPILTGVVVDRVVPRADADLLTLTTFGLATVLGFQWISSLVRSHLVLELRTKIDVRMTLGFVHRLVELPLEFFQTRSAGDLLLRVQSNAAIREILTAATLSTLLDGALGLGYLAAIVAFSPSIAGIVLAIGAAQAALWLLSRRRVQELMARELEAKSRAQSHLAQVIAGIETLKLSGAEQRGVERYADLFVDELNVALARGRLDAGVESLRQVLMIGAPLVLLVHGAGAVLDGSMTLGAMLALSALATGFLTPLGDLVATGLRLATLAGYIERVDDVLRATPERATGAKLPLSGAVSLHAVRFRYGRHAPEVLRGVDLEIPAGRTVAIVGSSGSGKSTLARLLLGLARPAAGAVRFDGVDLDTLDLVDLRRQVGMVSQHPYVFAGTVREYIALGRPSATLPEIAAAAAMACIHDEVLAMPMGYETPIAEGGGSLSGGQRQRLALARVLLAQPRLLVLDEATSHLDAVTEATVVHNLERLACTTVVIAHRLSTIVRADEILVLDRGVLVERGTHGELLARGGAYAKLVAAQARLEEEP